MPPIVAPKKLLEASSLLEIEKSLLASKIRLEEGTLSEEKRRMRRSSATAGLSRLCPYSASSPLHLSFSFSFH